MIIVIFDERSAPNTQQKDKDVELINRHKASGQSVAAFCRENGIARSSFYAARDRVCTRYGVPYKTRRYRSTKQLHEIMSSTASITQLA